MSRRPPWTAWRRGIQTAVVVVFLALPVAAAAGFRGAYGTLAAFSLGPVDVVEPVGAASALLAGGAVTASLLLGIVPLALLALALGPVFCSWVCPWGFLSEGVDRLLRRLHRRRARGAGRIRRTWPPESFRHLARPRIAVFLAVLAASLALGAPLAALLSPPRLATTLPLEAIFLRAVSTVTAGLLAGLLVLEVALGAVSSKGGGRRLWCRALCPVGTGTKLLRQPRTLTLAWDEASCSCPGVPVCQTTCAWGIDPRRMNTFDGCTNCFACVASCPTGSLAPAFGRSARGRGGDRHELEPEGP